MCAQSVHVAPFSNDIINYQLFVFLGKFPVAIDLTCIGPFVSHYSTLLFKILFLGLVPSWCHHGAIMVPSWCHHGVIMVLSLAVTSTSAISRVYKSSFYHIRNLLRIYCHISISIAKLILTPLISSRLDYYKSLLNNISKRGLAELQSGFKKGTFSANGFNNGNRLNGSTLKSERVI